jgi:putative transposase
MGRAKRPLSDHAPESEGRGFQPEYVLMDSWYASLENLKAIVSFGWRFLTRLKGNRLVNPEGKEMYPSVRWKSLGEGGWFIFGVLGS